MFYREMNELGSVGFSRTVIGQIVVETVNSFHGRVHISNSKGRVPALTKLGLSDQMGCIGVTMDETGLEIKVYIVVRFGTSIAMVSNGIIDMLEKRLPEMTGIVPKGISVIVTGVSVGSRIAKRQLEVRSSGT